MRKLTQAEAAAWINSELRPDIVVTATIKQSIGHFSGNGKYWERGNPYRYEAAVEQFLKRLTIACKGKNDWRRHHKLLPVAVTLEGDGNGQAVARRSDPPSFSNGFQSGPRHMRYHLNMMFRRPDWIPLEIFQQTIRNSWATSSWSMTDVKIEERQGDFAYYALKEGWDSLLLNCVSF
ncbi:hypothetical protein [Sphingobium phenoxybenzoativorans]|uniref:hypothetical protein n=1 Tax=Sphingobium phenoxybenzoativorans TaxID=1592790 RepID=UPI001112D617|nr:hypothetical protein [Sphingobium phenoxybenzoativorans]